MKDIETVEEAAKRIAKDHCSKRINTNTTEFQVQQLILKGACWQSQRMYTEEDMKECWKASSAYTIGGYKEFKQTHPDFKEWLEQFKKKV
jgi:hypothetical protein